MQIQSQKRPQRGLTMVEACCVLAIGGILASAAVPSFKRIGDRVSLEGVVGEMAGDLRFARSEAVARNQGVRVSFYNESGRSCYIVHTGSRADCRCGSAGDAVCRGPANAIKSVHLGASQTVRLESNVASLRFDPTNGTVQSAGTICATGADGQRQNLVINILGRTRSCVPVDPHAPCRVC